MRKSNNFATGAWRVLLVCPHSISVSVIINYTNMAAKLCEARLFNVKSEFLLNLDIVMKKTISAVLASFKKTN